MNFLPPRQGFYQESSSHTHGGGAPPSPSPPIQREHMFDKVVTPSDVGKLNRLVIPKQHAEKYFPLDSSASDKGLLLNFEDRNGKPWRFRYSYWNSSQSYVMTKGWSRFVKDKKLDAGDVVSFQRGLGDLLKDRLFIDWRRRPDAPPDLLPHRHFSSAFHHRIPPPNPTFLMRDHNYPYSHSFLQGPNYQYPYHPYGSSIVNGNPCSIVYPNPRGVFSGDPQIPAQHNTIMDHQMVFDSVPVVQGKAAAKRFRLFGVNMDCPISDQDSENECHVLLTSSSSSSLARLRHNDGTDKPKGSMSLDLDI